MTERQKKLLEEIPKSNHNIAEAARKVGYSESYIQGRIYNAVRNCKGFEKKSDEAIKDSYLKDTKKLKKRFIKSGDNTNASRMHEIIGKVEGLFKDAVTSTNQSTIIIDRQNLTDTGKAITSIEKDNGKAGLLEGKEGQAVDAGEAVGQEGLTLPPPIGEVI